VTGNGEGSSSCSRVGRDTVIEVGVVLSRINSDARQSFWNTSSRLPQQLNRFQPLPGKRL
jgi:hypothetical protein